MNAEDHAPIRSIAVPREGSVRAKYRILAQLGEGGMATVHLAVARGPSGFNKLVVLKELKPDLADDPDLRKMFLREAQLAARLNHPGVVQTYEVIATAGAPLIVMEYLDGQTLAKIRQRAKGAFGLGSHLRIIADATAALHYAHELTDFDGRPVGLVHRDMTPHNVFVTFEGQVKLLDFGIAKLATSSPETKVGVIKGKLRYMPPEQLAGEAVDRRTDIYAVGVMLWEAATGQPMWRGCSDVVVMKRVLGGEIPRPRSIQPQVPEPLEAICMKALSPAPADRYATAAELEGEIETLLDDLGSRVNGRTIARYTSTLFADARAETKSLIEAQLSQLALLPTDEVHVAPSLGRESISTLASGARLAATRGPSPIDAADPSADAVAHGGPYRRWRVAFAAAVLAFVAGATLLLLRPTGTGTRAGASLPAAGTARPPAEAPGAAVAGTRASIRIVATPREATIAVDGQALDANPAIASLPVGTEEHHVTVAAPGYEPRSSAFVADRDAEIVVDLERTRPAAHDTPARGAASPAAPVHTMASPATGEPWAAHPALSPTPAATPARTDRCHPPYEIDASGIKRFKVECL